MARWIRIMLAIMLAIPVSGFAAPEPEELARLVNRGDMARAWELASEHRAELEGDPVFDLHYGIAALETGHHGEAVFALRRVLALRPDLDRARLALARAHFETGNDPAARAEFERLLAGDPPEPVRAAIERHLAALDRRASRYSTAVSGHVEIGGGHDSNVNSASTLDEVDIVGTIVPIKEGGQAQADDFARIAGGLRVAHPLTPATEAFASLSGERRYHDEHDAFAVGDLLLRTGVSVGAEQTRTTLGLHGQRVWLDGEYYRDLGGVDADVRYALSDQHIVGVSGRYSQLDHDTARDRDSDLWQLSVRTTRLWRVPLRPQASLSLSYGEERARRDTNTALARAQRDIHGAAAGLRLRLAPRWTLSGDLNYRRSEYAEPEPLFGETREDDYYSATFGLEWRVRHDWRVRLRMLHADNDSSLDFYDYERDLVELRLRHEFHH